MKQKFFISLVLLTLSTLACAVYIGSPTPTDSTTVAVSPTTPLSLTLVPTVIIPTSAASASPVATIIPSSTPAPSPTFGIGATFTSSKDDMVLMYVPAGEFKMGTTPIESQMLNEKPIHTVYLDAFWMDKTEMSNARYALCVKDGKCAPPTITQSTTRPRYYGNLDFNNYPVIGITWDEAKNYCQWAGRRLPTEAEWEKAARGTDGRTYPWGNNLPDSITVNFGRMIGDTTEVIKYPYGVSPYGVMDLAGNVSEWIADWYDEHYFESSPPKNPQGPATGQLRAVRGGAWDFSPQGLRVAQRAGATPTIRAFNMGFRCVMSATP